VNPISRQMAFDFELAPCAGMETARRPSSAPPEIAAQAQEMFLRAVRLEESNRTVAEAAEMYRGILELQPNHAPAAINLGTIYYNQRDFAGAERMYRQATVADPEYALAFFDLGNVLDEQQRLPEAIVVYEQALKLVPGYADAHYNIALAYERMKEPRKALRHWTAYAKLDPTGPWASQAHSRRGAAGDRLPPRADDEGQVGYRAATRFWLLAQDSRRNHPVFSIEFQAARSQLNPSPH
jgi:tetratricopeptide (TPR) repeat protein